MERQFHILSVGYDLTLLHTRSMLLRSRGYSVTETHSLAEAQSLVESGQINLVLMCHTVPESDQLKLIRAVRRVRDSLPVLCITDQEFASVANDCEATSNSPMELLESVREAADRSWGGLSPRS